MRSLQARVPADRLFRVPVGATAVNVAVAGAQAPADGLFQRAIGAGQVAKFGGRPLFFANLSQANWQMRILRWGHCDRVGARKK